jgi:hypothetical protein
MILSAISPEPCLSPRHGHVSQPYRISFYILTYIYEQVFSTMKINKNKTRSRITNNHLHAILRVNSNKLEPNINVL